MILREVDTMSRLEIRQMHLGPIRTNCYLAVNKETKEVLIVDPADNAGNISARLAEEGLTPKAVLLTHGHRDHIGAVPELRSHYGIPVYVGREDEAMLEDAQANLSLELFGKALAFHGDVLLTDKEELRIAGFRICVFHTPGHTPGGCCFYLPEEGILFSGDTLFCESVGRTDFPGGSSRKLLDSVQRLLRELPGETRVLPGHECETTIAHEKRYNPYA